MNAITDAEIVKIQREAQEILKKFSGALAKVKIVHKNKTEKVGGFRGEGSGSRPDGDFRARMFANAPKHDDDCIIAEKKTWS